MKDQLGRTLQLNTIPQRIISIVPSQTELLYELGLDETVVGITKFCIHPTAWFRQKKRVGGTKNINLKIVRTLRPDIIFANKEENTQSDIEQLTGICPVWVSDIQTFEDAMSMIEAVGTIVGKQTLACSMTMKLKSLQYTSLQKYPHSISTLYLIWKNPYMAAGIDTFINDMMRMAGFSNVIQQQRYPILEMETLKQLQPSLVFLSSEPYPFKQKDIDALQQIFPHAQLILVDGELFSWYGSRLLKSFDYFSALHEQIH